MEETHADVPEIQLY